MIGLRINLTLLLAGTPKRHKSQWQTANSIYAGFFLAAARILDGFGRFLPCDPRRILPRLLLKSPLPMFFDM